MPQFLSNARHHRRLLAGSCCCLILIVATPMIQGQTQALAQPLALQESQIIEAPQEQGKIELINLNRYINKWFLLKNRGSKPAIFHIENISTRHTLQLTPTGLALKEQKTGKIIACPLWKTPETSLWQQDFTAHKNPFRVMCDGLLYLRLKRNSTTKLSLTEWATEILRKREFGENLINFFKPFIVSLKAEEAVVGSGNLVTSLLGQPLKLLGAALNKTQNQTVEKKNHHLGIITQDSDKKMLFGHWYPTDLYQDIFVSLMSPALIEQSIMDSYPQRVNTLATSEENKLVYLTAYDLSQYTVRYVHGTQYPGISAAAKAQDPNLEQLNLIGSIPPYHMQKAVSVFIGGYKMKHGTFKYGPHQGKRYGYIENGVALSPLQADLATLYITNDDKIQISSWPAAKEKQDALRKTIVSARQNGVLIIDKGQPTPYVNKWGHGNWSGDANGNLRTLRSAVCLQQFAGKQYLVFAAFTGATPSAMARVLQSYKCQTAMQLDMNAYMYLHNAIFKMNADNKNLTVQYLHKEMEYPKGTKHPRFLLDNNNRDFFFVMKKENPAPAEQKIFASSHP